MKVPKKFTSLLPPTIVDLPSGRYFIITGETHGGWYPIGKDFDYQKVMKGWTQQRTTEKTQKALSQVWQIANSKNQGFYTVSVNNGNWSCSCTGFGFRRKCRHIDEAKLQLK